MVSISFSVDSLQERLWQKKKKNPNSTLIHFIHSLMALDAAAKISRIALLLSLNNLSCLNVREQHHIFSIFYEWISLYLMCRKIRWMNDYLSNTSQSTFLCSYQFLISVQFLHSNDFSLNTNVSVSGYVCVIMPKKVRARQR